MSSYVEQLKDPRWQKKRLEILERDGWQCQGCGSKTGELHIHHAYYNKGKKPWEYDDLVYATLCTGCHYRVHQTLKAIAAAFCQSVHCWYDGGVCDQDAYESLLLVFHDALWLKVAAPMSRGLAPDLNKASQLIKNILSGCCCAKDKSVGGVDK